MERRRLWPMALVLFLVGAGTFSRFATHVRTVEAVGLSGAGFSIGVGFALLMFKPGRPV